MIVTKLTTNDILAIEPGQSMEFTFPTVRAMLNGKTLTYYARDISGRSISTSVNTPARTLRITVKDANG